MKTAVIKLKDINPATYNPRITLKPGDAEYEALKNSLDKFGTVAPLIVNETTGNLVSGHQRLNILKANGANEVEVVLISVDSEKEKLLNIALNKIDGEWDFKKLEELFEEFSEEDIQFTGFSREEVDELLNAEITPPGFDYEDDEDDSETDNSSNNTAKEKPEKEFNIFLSFPDKETAEAWLEEKGQDYKFKGTSTNITIRMEGADFGTGN